MEKVGRKSVCQPSVHLCLSDLLSHPNLKECPKSLAFQIVHSLFQQRNGYCVIYTVEPLNNRDECFVHCREVVPSLEVEMYGQYIGRKRTACPL